MTTASLRASCCVPRGRNQGAGSGTSLGAMEALNGLHDVGAIPPGLVEAGATEDRVLLAVACIELVVPGTADHVVAAGPSREDVVADPALEDVVPAAAVELVVAAASEQ